ncbi:MAG: hypothetical protein KF819_28595 [Labilithrix sp.]|nr:hypothetical protein [Labilithrix sp.]
MLETNDTRTRRTRAGALALAALAASTILATPRSARAEEVAPDGKGIVGGALLGAELVVFTEALFGVRSGTAYLLGAAGGAVAGGLGGYGVESAVDDGRVPAYMLAGGLALIIPALVVALDQTRYMPTEGAREDKPITNLPPSDPGKPGGSSVVGAEPGGTPAPAPPPAPEPAPTPAPTPPSGGGGGNPGPQSFFNMYDGNVRFGVPVPHVRPIFSQAERKQLEMLGVQTAATEVRFPVVRVSF